MPPLTRAEAAEITRLRQQNAAYNRQIGAVGRRLDEIDRRGRRVDIEGRVTRLALEVELDAAAEVDRLVKLSAEDVDAEISLMRARYKPRPALGTPPEEDAVRGNPHIRIFGESVARMALDLEDSGTPILVSRENHRGFSARRRDALNLARAAVRRFAAKRAEVSRA